MTGVQTCALPISVDLREVAKARGARIIEIQEDAAHNVRKVLEELLNNN